MAVLMLMNVVAFGHEGHSAAGVSSKLITVTGKIKALRSDDFKNKKSTSEFSVEDSSTGKIYTLHFSGTAGKKMFHGNEVTLKARDMGGDHLYMGNNDGTAILSAGADLAIAGDQRTLVMMVSFIDAQVTCSQQQVNDLAFTDPNGYSMAGMYRETSFGAMTVSGQTIANVTVPSTSTGCDYNTWAQQADQAASQMGVNLNNFPRRIYVLPGGQCGWAGLGNLGGTVTRSWIAAGYCGYHDVYAHEFGHNIGMHHSGTSQGQYHDLSDIMGYGGVGLRQVNGPHKVQMGWLPNSSVVRAGSGTHTLIPLEQAPGTGTGASVLTIPKPDTGDTYYLSYRRPIGLDARLGSSYLDRLSIHTFRGGSTITHLVTTLGEGEVYSDAGNGITIQVTSRTDSAMTVAINAVCVSASPIVTIAPGTQGGGAGSALSYQISVQNRDSAICTPSTFSLSAMVPQGFSGALSTSALAIDAGSTATASITVTSTAGTPAGTYAFSVSAIDGSVPVHSASGSGNYVIDGEAPSAPTGLASSSKGRNLSLRWNPSTDNVGVTAYTIYRDGAAIGTSAGNSFTTSQIAGSYHVTARDAAGNISGASNVIIVTSSGGKPRR